MVQGWGEWSLLQKSQPSKVQGFPPIIDQAQEWQTLQEKTGRSVALARVVYLRKSLIHVFFGSVWDCLLYRGCPSSIKFILLLVNLKEQKSIISMCEGEKNMSRDVSCVPCNLAQLVQSQDSSWNSWANIHDWSYYLEPFASTRIQQGSHVAKGEPLSLRSSNS